MKHQAFNPLTAAGPRPGNPQPGPATGPPVGEIFARDISDDRIRLVRKVDEASVKERPRPAWLLRRVCAMIRRWDENLRPRGTRPEEDRSVPLPEQGRAHTATENCIPTGRHNRGAVHSSDARYGCRRQEGLDDGKGQRGRSSPAPPWKDPAGQEVYSPGSVAGPKLPGRFFPFHKTAAVERRAKCGVIILVVRKQAPAGENNKSGASGDEGSFIDADVSPAWGEPWRQ